MSADLPVSRRSAVPPFLVMDVVVEARRLEAAGRDIVHLEIGEPGGGPPALARQAAVRTLDGAGGDLGYAPAMGLPDLRRRIASHYQDWYGVTVDPARIAVTSGASGGFVLAFLAAFDAGARVVVTDPSYPCYRNVMAALGIEPVRITTGPADGFQPTPAELDAVPGRIDGLILQSPANPTGTMLDDTRLAALAEWARLRGVRLIVDEIYQGITYEVPSTTVLKVEPQAVVVNSFSKFWAMTGWRVGWLVLPENMVRPVERLAQNMFISTSTISQTAAKAAMDAEAELRPRVDHYRHNRDLLKSMLHAVGLQRIAPPDGAFYLWVDVRPTGLPATTLAGRLLHDAHVAVTPGVDFDPVEGEHWIRLSFAGPTERVAIGAERLAAALAPMLR
ncbi:MAG TPA: aminotransferase class I/II-fold pyridoxal phosphate-dependent enzyme [Geminicoccus sp.]|jgi:aspartate/methionine/tyrosine aminotransferase|uniref:pyridoxal phosphate-dependent aminotransferase n=1 Tax=Geminicoccus sp. TaxID=2024832 RepID=UPI002E36DFB1|nr:aminotransferase class I/II-fold pyridoxal phosphate-dependent enzyme [Geminicoccus sp.]HEX2525871.1 aminotransferase class I/II-fold pyridoxal phosphate-dependent enzyme [Geminicoccus sp.]